MKIYWVTKSTTTGYFYSFSSSFLLKIEGRIKEEWSSKTSFKTLCCYLWWSFYHGLIYENLLLLRFSRWRFLRHTIYLRGLSGQTIVELIKVLEIDGQKFLYCSIVYSSWLRRCGHRQGRFQTSRRYKKGEGLGAFLFFKWNRH